MSRSFGAWIIERLDRKLMSRRLISNHRFAGSRFKMAFDWLVQTSRNVGFVTLHVVLFRSF